MKRKGEREEGGRRGGEEGTSAWEGGKEVRRKRVNGGATK